MATDGIRSGQIKDSAIIEALIADTAVTNAKLAGSIAMTKLDIAGGTNLGGASLDQADEFPFSDAGTQKVVTFSNLEDSIFGNISGDATVAAGGALTIANSAVTDAMLAGSISFSKLTDSANIARLDQAESVAAVWSFGANIPTASANPSADNELARKAYVDSLAQGLDIKQSVVAFADFADLPANTAGGSGVGATLTANANGAFPAQDGVTLIANERVLVAQDDGTANADHGIYTLTQVGDGSNPWILTRATDFDENDEVTAGAFMFIEEGTSYGDTGWVLTTNDAVTVDTTAMAFTQFTGVGSITAGVGLAKSGNTLSLDMSELAEAALADGDYIVFLDGGASGADRKEAFADVVSLMAGAGLAAASSVLSIDIDELGALGGATVAQADNLLISDAGTEKKVTFSNFEDSIFGNISGDATVAAGGALTIAANAVEASMLNTDAISGQTEMTGDLADTDELMVSDAGVLKRADFSVVRDAVFADVSGDATIAAGGALTIAADSVQADMLNDDLMSGQDLALTGAVADTDELLISDAGALKRVDWSVLRDAAFGDVSGDATIAAGGALTIANGAVETAMLANDNVTPAKMSVDPVIDVASYAGGAQLTVSINPSTTEAFTLDGETYTTGTEFSAGVDANATAQNIAAAINSGTKAWAVNDGTSPVVNVISRTQSAVAFTTVDSDFATIDGSAGGRAGNADKGRIVAAGEMILTGAQVSAMGSLEHSVGGFSYSGTNTPVVKSLRLYTLSGGLKKELSASNLEHKVAHETGSNWLVLVKDASSVLSASDYIAWEVEVAAD